MREQRDRRCCLIQNAVIGCCPIMLGFLLSDAHKWHNMNIEPIRSLMLSESSSPNLENSKTPFAQLP